MQIVSNLNIRMRVYHFFASFEAKFLNTFCVDNFTYILISLLSVALLTSTIFLLCKYTNLWYLTSSSLLIHYVMSQIKFQQSSLPSFLLISPDLSFIFFQWSMYTTIQLENFRKYSLHIQAILFWFISFLTCNVFFITYFPVSVLS